MESGTDAFSDYLGRRATHHKTRLEKVSKYKALNPSQLNEDQRTLLADSEKAEGKLEETEFLKEKYQTHREQHAQLFVKELDIAKEQGIAEARVEFVDALAQLSSFLHSMSSLYKAGHSRADSREAYAFFKLLEGFYAGGKAGGEVMQRFIAGENTTVCENGIKYSDLKSQLNEMIESIIKEPTKTPKALKPPTQPDTYAEIISRVNQEPGKTKNLSKQTLKQASGQKPGKPSCNGIPKASSPTKTSRSDSPEATEDKESFEVQDSSDQFQIVGAKTKDKANKNPRRKANQKKKQAQKNSYT